MFFFHSLIYVFFPHGEFFFGSEKTHVFLIKAYLFCFFLVESGIEPEQRKYSTIGDDLLNIIYIFFDKGEKKDKNKILKKNIVYQSVITGCSD